MISRPTLIAALVVAELAIVGAAFKAIDGYGGPPAPFSFNLPTGAFASQAGALDRTFVTGFSPHVAVDIGDVNVTVETGTSPSVHVIETLAMGFLPGRPAPLVAQQTPDGIRVYATGNGSEWTIGQAHELRLIVPPGSRVALATGGTIDVSGLRAKLTAHTTDGHIHVHDQQGDIDVSTRDGRIELVDVQGTAIDAVTHDGRIYLTRVGADRIGAHSDSGRIVGESVRVEDGAITTNDGRIQMTFTPSSDATATVSTEGDIIVSGFHSSQLSEKSRSVTLGSGRGHVQLSTEGGDDITITPGANG